MGVKHAREYTDIVKELSAAIGQIEGIYRFMEMEPEDWAELDAGEQAECIETMADDVFYALGEGPVVALENGSVKYDKANHVLKVSDGDRLVSIIYLV